jgi:hypothetical protein
MAEQLRQSVELGSSSTASQSMHEGQSHQVRRALSVCLPPSTTPHSAVLGASSQTLTAAVLSLQDGWLAEPSSTSSNSPTKQALPNQALPSLAAKRKAASQFIRDCTGVSPPYATDQGFRTALKDGVLLCKVVNTVWPDAVKQVRPCVSPVCWRLHSCTCTQACISSQHRPASSTRHACKAARPQANPSTHVS